MRRFRFLGIRTLDELLAWKARLGADGWLIAGGTDLIVKLREQSAMLPPIEVADITAVRELGGISIDGDGGVPKTPRSQGVGGTSGWESRRSGGSGACAGPVTARIRIGPLATHAEVSEDAGIREWARLLSSGSSEVGSPQIRNRGTIGGNVCNASPCADTIPPLIALGATLVLRSAHREREVPIEEAILAPYKTVIAEDEILSEIRFDAPPAGAGSSFVKLGRRNALSISRMSLAVVVRRDDRGILRDVRVAAGSVAPVPRRFRSVEAVLDGSPVTPTALEAAGREMAEEMIRITGRRWSTPYKEPVAAALLSRAVARAIE